SCPSSFRQPEMSLIWLVKPQEQHPCALFIPMVDRIEDSGEKCLQEVHAALAPLSSDQLKGARIDEELRIAVEHNIYELKPRLSAPKLVVVRHPCHPALSMERLLPGVKVGSAGCFH